MDPERAIKFILDRQGKFAAGMIELQARQDRFQTELDDLKSVVATVTQAHLQAQLQTQEQIRLLAEAQRRTEEAHRRTEEAQRQTEEKLNALIAVVDGIVRRQPPQQ